MGVFGAIARVFGGSKQARPVGADSSGTRGVDGHDSLVADAPEARDAASEALRDERPTPGATEPVSIDLYIEDEHTGDAHEGKGPIVADDRSGLGSDNSEHPAEPVPAVVETTRSLGPVPKNRQELLNELRKNYSEVLGLVRKVDGHLDEQSHRSDRLLELAESSARNMECLPDLVEQNRRVADALGDLIELTRDARTRQDSAADRLTRTAVQQLESAQRQTAALQTMQAAMHRAGEADEKMAGSIAGFNDTLGAMSSSTRDLGQTIASMRETDAEREAELARLVASSQKWLVAAVVFCGLLALGALFAVLNNVI